MWVRFPQSSELLFLLLFVLLFDHREMFRWLARRMIHTSAVVAGSVAQTDAPTDKCCRLAADNHTNPHLNCCCLACTKPQPKPSPVSASVVSVPASPVTTASAAPPPPPPRRVYSNPAFNFDATSCCPALKLTYEACFQKWYSDEFLHGNSTTIGCTNEWNLYRTCVISHIEREGLTKELNELNSNPVFNPAAASAPPLTATATTVGGAKPQH